MNPLCAFRGLLRPSPATTIVPSGAIGLSIAFEPWLTAALPGHRASSPGGSRSQSTAATAATRGRIPAATNYLTLLLPRTMTKYHYDPRRSFTHSASRPKAPRKAAKETSTTSSSEHGGGGGSGNHPQPNPDEPQDFTDVTSRWAAIAAHSRDVLREAGTAGRYDPDVLGRLPVEVPDLSARGPHKRPARMYPLRDLAQVVGSGTGAGGGGGGGGMRREISMLVSEESFVKPIMAAIQRSDAFNAQPQRVPDNELELVLRVELERPEELAARVRAACHRWRERVREATTKREKSLKTWKGANVITPDVFQQLKKQLLLLQTKELAGIDQVEKTELQSLAHKKL